MKNPSPGNRRQWLKTALALAATTTGALTLGRLSPRRDKRGPESATKKPKRWIGHN